MLDRRYFTAVARVATVLAATIGAAGMLDCAQYSSGARDGTLGEMISPAKKNSSSPRASLGAILSGAPGTYIQDLLADRDSTIERWPDRVNKPILVWID